MNNNKNNNKKKVDTECPENPKVNKWCNLLYTYLWQDTLCVWFCVLSPWGLRQQSSHCKLAFLSLSLPLCGCGWGADLPVGLCAYLCVLLCACPCVPLPAYVCWHVPGCLPALCFLVACVLVNKICLMCPKFPLAFRSPVPSCVPDFRVGTLQ